MTLINLYNKLFMILKLEYVKRESLHSLIHKHVPLIFTGVKNDPNKETIPKLLYLNKHLKEAERFGKKGTKFHLDMLNIAENDRSIVFDFQRKQLDETKKKQNI